MIILIVPTLQLSKQITISTNTTTTIMVIPTWSKDLRLIYKKYLSKTILFTIVFLFIIISYCFRSLSTWLKLHETPVINKIETTNIYQNQNWRSMLYYKYRRKNRQQIFKKKKSFVIHPPLFIHVACNLNPFTAELNLMPNTIPTNTFLT